jgi:hypothetical protein
VEVRVDILPKAVNHAEAGFVDLGLWQAVSGLNEMLITYEHT